MVVRGTCIGLIKQKITCSGQRAYEFKKSPPELAVPVGLLGLGRNTSFVLSVIKLAILSRLWVSPDICTSNWFCPLIEGHQFVYHERQSYIPPHHCLQNMTKKLDHLVGSIPQNKLIFLECLKLCQPVNQLMGGTIDKGKFSSAS